MIAPATWANQLADLLFGHDPRMRIRVRLSFLAGVLYLGWGAMFMLGLQHDLLISRQAGYVLVVLDVVVALGFYPIVRSGLTARWADPALVLPQMVTAYVVCAFSYIITPDSRGSLLQLMCLIQVFGLISLTPREVRIAGAAGVASMVVAWLGGAIWAPIWAFDTNQEAITLSMGCFILILLAKVSHNYSLMRAKVRDQKQALAKAVQQVEHIVSHDPLTGLFNRRHMVEVIARESARTERSGVGMAVILIDLDHFKRINDTHGHQVGDEVLKAFADIALSAVRETDVIGRWGGEEFILLLPDTHPADRAMVVVNRIQNALANTAVCVSAPTLRVAFSAGVAIPKAAETLDQILERADQALYTAKDLGRCQAVVAP